MTASEFVLSQVDSPELVATARELFREYEAAIGTDLGYQGFASELATLPAPYTPPGGALLIARRGEQVAGCVGLRPMDAHVAEMKRLYVRPAHQGTGLGKRLVHAVIQAARHAGYDELRLDTLASMASAQALYQRLGFTGIPAYNSAHLPGTRFYSLRLATKVAGGMLR
jgi:GNAT superfamily N-acetyltransferase